MVIEINSLPIFIGAIANLSLNFFLIPEFGATGAAVATLISYICSPIIGMLVHSRETRENASLLLMPFL